MAFREPWQESPSMMIEITNSSVWGGHSFPPLLAGLTGPRICGVTATS